MRIKIWLVFTACVLMSMTQVAGATTILEETGFIFGFSGENFSFTANQTPTVYEVTLTDFEFPAAFDFLGVSITTSTDRVVELIAPGTTTFSVDLGTTYFANVLGITSDSADAGLFGIHITPTPIPPSALMLGSGVLGLALFWRRKK